MGLDMYLTGERCFMEIRQNRQLSSERYRFGYWRKHPNLHGYIVQEFADGIDDCREIDLTESELRQVLQAIETKALPHTEGFFFGESDGSEAEEDQRIFTEALDWLAASDEDALRFITYQASW